MQTYFIRRKILRISSKIFEDCIYENNSSIIFSKIFEDCIHADNSSIIFSKIFEGIFYEVASSIISSKIYDCLPTKLKPRKTVMNLSSDISEEWYNCSHGSYGLILPIVQPTIFDALRSYICQLKHFKTLYSIRMAFLAETLSFRVLAQ